jgi:DNA segregation ATPase FtsK/SpoIIIE, S-DNA-T family
VGTATSDIHVTNVPERHAVGLDLPIPNLTYGVSFDDLVSHPSFAAARRDLRLGFCCGIDVTGRALWADLAEMPHMLVAGTTGSGKTVFLRNVILTLLMHNGPDTLRLSSSKPMDFRVFTQAPHAADRPMAGDPLEATQLADELVREMERRYGLIDRAMCDNLAEYNRENPAKAEPYIVAVFDEYSEMVASFGEKSERDAFEGAIGRLAQKARAAGIHLVVCMQRPDANALKGAIKANILHRFALKLPQNHDSRIILDETGAETLLGQGDLLYKDANSRVARLQVPFLENAVLKAHLKRVLTGRDPGPEK